MTKDTKVHERKTIGGLYTKGQGERAAPDHAEILVLMQSRGQYNQHARLG